MKSTLSNITVIIVLASLLLAGCKKEEIPYFNGTNTANFWVSTQNHSFFGSTTDKLPYDTTFINIALSGHLSDKDRFITAVAVPDAEGVAADRRLTTATPDQYKIIGGVIPANKLYGKFKVVLMNPEILGTIPDLKVKIKMVGNEDLGIGLTENNFVNIKWSRQFLQPPTWNGMRFFFCSVYSSTVYKIFIEVTGLKEFLYYEGVISEAEGAVMGRNFGNRIRELSIQQGSPVLHEDGANKGLPIIPIN